MGPKPRAVKIPRVGDAARGRRRAGWEAYPGPALVVALTLVKVFLVDLSRFDAVYRILSFMVLGGCLVLVSFLYTKHRARLCSASRAGCASPTSDRVRSGSDELPSGSFDSFAAPA